MKDYPKISLRAARVNANLSQKEAAQRIGVCKATLQKYEAGVTFPDWGKLETISKVYDFPINYLEMR